VFGRDEDNLLSNDEVSFESDFGGRRKSQWRARA
jgi:hypothetical protein